MKAFWLAIAMLASALAVVPAQAEIREGGHRFSLSGGLLVVRNPNQTAFSVAAEYEYRAEPLLGFGAQASQVFADPSVTILSAPTLYLHPLLGDAYVSAAPVFYLISGADTRVGARFVARIPLVTSVFALIPTVGVDIIPGGPNYIFGLGISI